MTKNSVAELRKIVKLMKENQLNYIKLGDIEVNKNEWAVKAKNTQIKKLSPEEQMKIEEEELFWSAK